MHCKSWIKNDSGNWMYFEDGKKKIGSTTYEFDQYGMTALLPNEKRFIVHTVQKGGLHHNDEDRLFRFKME